MENKLNDSQLEGVSGGAQTSTGFEITNAGVVKFKDPNGVPLDISVADYNWLLTKYSGVTRRDQEVALATVNAGDVRSLINQHHAGTLK